MQALSNRPLKGASDWWPDEFAVRYYIFETWRQVNRRFGYQEYLTPILELADIYRAKSGEDVGGKELMTMVDRGGRELAIRPEMTPSVTRMVSRFYKQSPRPLRLYSIANFWRNENPQRGRNREFWQLNADIFGSHAVNADLEILQLALELMLAFNAPAGSFTLFLNHRQLIDAILNEVAGVPAELHTATVRLLDKAAKMSEEKLVKALGDVGLAEETVTKLVQFINSKTAVQLLEYFPELADNSGYQATNYLFETLTKMGYEDWVQFNPSIIRGFDYYDGMVFEIFDNHPDNKRALFGGGRYNGLAHLFGAEDIPAVGFAPGDETTKLFLKSWDLLPDTLTQTDALYFPLLDAALTVPMYEMAQQLRQTGFDVELGIEVQKFKQAFSYANKRGYPYVLLLGSREYEQGTITLKNMVSGEQQNLTLAGLIEQLQGGA